MRAPVAAFALGPALVVGSLALRPPPGDSGSAGPSRPEYGQPAKIRPIQGLNSALFAKEPYVQDPVAFCIDERGRLYVAESFRQERGIEDNRSSPWWLLDDLQSQTIDDRLRMYEKWASKREGGMDYYSRHEDRVTRVEDSDGDLRADRVTLFATPFREPLDGTGAGVIARDGDVWYTNIPHLWRLRDPDNDGVAEERERMWTGFGVRIALRGHDMHGLTWGPDGKLYWSIGDRGYHVTLPDGRVLADPRSGAVFRCYPDGSGLEIFCTGLRNPQELAFDDFGNLFTGDNNSDGGDKARIVYCVEGGDTGWRMDYQTLEGANARGPWNQEDTWAMRADLAPDRVSANSPVQPAWTVPPLSHVSSGPSGLAHYPGLGLPERYAGHFFLCDFLGGDAYSRVLSFAVEPVGAGFKVVDVHPFVENVLPTDVDFGYDGRMYISDWGGGWYSKGAGEIYVVWDPIAIDDPRIAEVTRLFREGFAHRGAPELRKLLGHPDRRVRQRAQFALADLGPSAVPVLVDVAEHGLHRLARIHAMWALQQVALDGAWPEAVSGLVPRLDDPDPEIRSQAAKVLGEARHASALPELVHALSDPSARVRYFAAMSIGKLRATSAKDAIIAMLAENDGDDVFLRHAGVWALEQMGDRAAVGALAAEPQAELRLCAALVLRRWGDPSIARLLVDSDPRVAIEAARAINDLPIDAAMPELVGLSRLYLGGASAEGSQPGTAFVREIWKGVDSAGRTDLLAPSTFNRDPDEADETPVFEGKAGAGDRYMQRVSGLIRPAETGSYIFYIASDDDSVLLLSPNEQPSLASPIARVEGYTGRGEWMSQPGQVSGPILLEAGQAYYIEARHAEGGGDDHLAVAWQRPDGSHERPIGAGVSRPLDAPLLRRIVNACVRSNDVAAASVLADLARSAAVPESMRAEAMHGLSEWLTPSPRDRVTGAWRPVDASKRPREAYQSVLGQKLPGLATAGSPGVRALARELAATHGVTLDGAASFSVVRDPGHREEERAACLRQLCIDGDARCDEAIELALQSDAPLLRAEARHQRAVRDPQSGVPLLADALAVASDVERQLAVTALLDVRGPESDSLVAEALSMLESDSLDRLLWADVLRVAEAREGSDLAARARAWLAARAALDPVTRFAAALEGGDPKRGSITVHSHTSATCLKCHSIAGVGGDAAPSLDGVGTRLSRDKLLESLVEPGASIADGFGSASAMPSMATALSLDELRDVVEYLSTLR